MLCVPLARSDTTSLCTAILHVCPDMQTLIEPPQTYTYCGGSIGVVTGQDTNGLCNDRKPRGALNWALEASRGERRQM